MKRLERIEESVAGGPRRLTDDNLPLPHPQSVFVNRGYGALPRSDITDDYEVFGQNLQKSLIRSAAHSHLIDPDFEIVVADLDHAGFSRVRSHVDPDQHTWNASLALPPLFGGQDFPIWYSTPLIFAVHSFFR